MQGLQVGDRAPEIVLACQGGESIRLGDFKGEKSVVLFFYPKSGTALCTREACAFRDAYDVLIKAGAVVIGISADSAESQAAFAGKHALPYYLCSDADGSARRAFGVPKMLGLLPGRVTYLIDQQGIVQLVFNSQLSPDRHVREAIEALKRRALAT